MGYDGINAQRQFMTHYLSLFKTPNESDMTGVFRYALGLNCFNKEGETIMEGSRFVFLCRHLRGTPADFLLLLRFARAARWPAFLRAIVANLYCSVS